MSLKALANRLAKEGRFGDTMLLHVHKDEVAGLAALAGGKLTTNPSTGLPEAFFFLPFLAGLAPAATTAATAAAAAAPALAAAAAPALSGGLAAGMAAASSALPAAATTAAALPAAAEIAAPAIAAGTGLPAGIEALTSTVAAAPAVGQLGSGAGLLGGAVPNAAALEGLMGPAIPASSAYGAAAANPITVSQAAAPAAFSVAPEGAGVASLMGTNPLAGEATRSIGLVVPEAAGTEAGYAATTTPLADAAAIQGGAAAPAAEGGVKGMLSGVGNWIKENPMMALGGLGALAQMMPMGGGGDDEEEEGKDISDIDYESEGGVEPTFPDSDLGGYGRGADAFEFDFFPGMANGGIVKLAVGGSVGGGYSGMGNGRGNNDRAGGGSRSYDTLQQQAAWRRMHQQPLMNFRQQEAPVYQASPFNYVPMQRRVTPNIPVVNNVAVNGWSRSRVPAPAPVAPAAPAPAPVLKSGGLVKGYAAGGVASLAPQMQDPGMPMQAPAAAPAAPSMQAEPTPQPIPSSPYPKTQTGSKSDTDKELIAQTVAAIKGVHPNPNQVLIAFVQTFGEQALQDLVARVRGGGPAAAGPAPGSDGMSDSIPAMIDGQQPAALSEGEFVVPADVVSGLGNGSTDAGATALMDMVGRTRQMRGGGPVQPPAIDPRKAMPI